MEKNIPISYDRHSAIESPCTPCTVYTVHTYRVAHQPTYVHTVHTYTHTVYIHTCSLLVPCEVIHSTVTADGYHTVMVDVRMLFYSGSVELSLNMGRCIELRQLPQETHSLVGTVDDGGNVCVRFQVPAYFCSQEFDSIHSTNLQVIDE